MPQTLASDPRLKRILALAAQLPATTHELAPKHATLRVRGKVFAYFLADHDNDGITALCVRGADGEHSDRVSRDPARFYLPPYIGRRGWFGLRFGRARIDWDEVQNLLELSYCRAAPHALAARLHAAAAARTPPKPATTQKRKRP